jgi:hypothetical protein
MPTKNHGRFPGWRPRRQNFGRSAAIPAFPTAIPVSTNETVPPIQEFGGAKARNVGWPANREIGGQAPGNIGSRGHKKSTRLLSYIL